MPAPPSSTDDMAAKVPRWAVWVPVLFAVGIAVYLELPVEPPPPVAAGRFNVSGIGDDPRRGPRSLAGDLAGGALVLAKTGWHDIDGRVVDISRTGAGNVLILDDVRLGTVPSAATPARVRVQVHRPPPGLRVGDRLHCRARSAPPPPPEMPGGFDFQCNAFFACIGATGVMIGAQTRIAGAGAGCVTAIADLRARAGHRIADILISPRFPVWRGCDSPRLVLDADDFKRAGAHAIWLRDGEIIVRNVAAARGRRPWVGAAR